MYVGAGLLGKRKLIDVYGSYESEKVTGRNDRENVSAKERASSRAGTRADSGSEAKLAGGAQEEVDTK